MFDFFHTNVDLFHFLDFFHSNILFSFFNFFHILFDFICSTFFHIIGLHFFPLFSYCLISFFSYFFHTNILFHFYHELYRVCFFLQANIFSFYEKSNFGTSIFQISFFYKLVSDVFLNKNLKRNFDLYEFFISVIIFHL